MFSTYFDVNIFKEKEKGLTFNMIHLIGNDDFLRLRAEACYNFFKELEAPDSLYSCELIRFPEDHKLPSIVKSRAEIGSFFAILEDNLERNSPFTWCFDFDGVLCDSVRETGLSGLKTGQKVAPKFFSAEHLEAVSLDENKIIDLFVKVRPLLETGFESTILLFLCLQACDKLRTTTNGNRDSEVVRFVNEKVDTIGLDACTEEFCQSFEVGREHLMNEFTATRAAWIETGLNDWLQQHKFFTIAKQCLQKLLCNESTRDKVYIITTKQKQFAVELLSREFERLQGFEEVDFSSRVFGLGSGPKYEVIKQILNKHPGRCFFIEDRLSTLQKAKVSGIEAQCVFALAKWGYNTKNQQEQAKKEFLGFWLFCGV